MNSIPHNRKYLSFILSFILVLSMLFSAGCSKKDNTADKENTGGTFVEKTTEEPDTKSTQADAAAVSSLFNFSLYDSSVSYSKEDLTIQKNFETFLASLFAEEYAQNSININFLIESPEKYGIERIPSSWPSVDIETIKTYYQKESEWLEELKKFSYSSLTYEQQLIYDMLKTSFEDDADIDDYLLFESPFGSNGLTSQLPLILTEYSFYRKENIEEYLGLLETLQEYVRQELDLKKYRMSQGYYLSDYAYDTAISQCEAFLNQGSDYLSQIFNDKLADFTELSTEEIETYKNRNSAAITASVIPSYHLMIDTLTAYKSEHSDNTGLAAKEHGKNYYSYLLKSETGTSKTPDELIRIIDKKLSTYVAELTALVTLNPDIYDKMSNPEYKYSDPDDILSWFSEQLKEDFPEAVCTDYTLKETDTAMSDDLVVAFYILSPIDNFKNNTIYTNPDHISEGNDLFPTLAHEGLPGHMYQHNYFCSLNPHYFRTLLNFTGYSEAWAQYVEIYSYDWSGMDNATAKALKINSLYTDALSCRIDLGINYEGWTLDDTSKYMKKLGITDDDTIKAFYNTLVSSPAVFAPYYVGYLELEDLKSSAKKALGDDFYLKDFHKFYLEIGPCYFDLIQDRMNDWIDRIKAQ